MSESLREYLRERYPLKVFLPVAMGLTMLLAGRGTLGASLERTLLFVSVNWLIGTSLLTVLRNSVKVEPWNSQTASQLWRPGSPS